MRALNFYSTSNIDDLTHPEFSSVLNLQSSALEFFTDFTLVQPLVIEADVSALDIQKIMQKEHVRLKFVIGEDNEFLGIVSADNVTDRKIIQRISHGERREDISLRELMVPKQELSALDYAEVKTASIAQVIDALKCSGVQHALVVDREVDRIRGIFSTSDISRKLKLPIDIHDRPSFSKVFKITD